MKCLLLVMGSRLLHSKKCLCLIAVSFFFVVSIIFRAPFKNAVRLSADKDEQRVSPVTKFAFMKNHKCASTTIDSIIFRFAEKNNLNLVLPVNGNYLSKTTLFDHTFLNSTKWKDVNFDIFCLHNRWNRKEVMKVLGKETVPTFTVVRDPVDVFVSMFHFQDGLRQFYEVKNIHEMVSKISNTSRVSDLRRRWMGSIGHNQMAWDLGLSPDIYEDEDEMKAEIKRLDGEFNLVMVTERIGESLVLLRYLLNWSIDDVVHLNLNRRKLEKSPKLTSYERKVLAKWLAADVQIYEHFSRRFDERVSQFNKMYGSIFNAFHAKPMKKELDLLEDANKKLYGRCVLQEVGNEKLKGQYKWLNDNVMGFIINEEEKGCASFARSELAYLKIFKNRLYSFIKQT